MNGNGLLYDKSRLGEALGSAAVCFTFDKFRQMCIMSGCDYLPNLPGIGLQKAMKFFKQTQNPNLRFVGFLQNFFSSAKLYLIINM